MQYKVIETDNFAGDYPNESFLNIPLVNEAEAIKIAAAINNSFHENSPRYWMAVSSDYELEPGFEL